MPTYTVTIKDEHENTKTVTVNTTDANVVMSETIVPERISNEVVHYNTERANSGVEHSGGKRSAPFFRLKKRRITRKLKKTR